MGFSCLPISHSFYSVSFFLSHLVDKKEFAVAIPLKDYLVVETYDLGKLDPQGKWT